jgi:DNA primase
VFAAHLGKNLFHCFRCGAGGNALDLWMALTGLPLHAAVLDLCQRLHQEVPWLGHRQPPAGRDRSPQENAPMSGP